METSGDLGRDDEDDDEKEEDHIDDHLFLHNPHLAGVQGFAPHGMDRDGVPNILHHDHDVEENPDVVNEDDSLLFDFAGRNPSSTVPQQMHHLHMRQVSGQRQPNFQTVNVNLEELHREEQKRMLIKQQNNEQDDEWSLQDKKRPIIH